MAEDPRLCGCGQLVPSGRHGRFCSSWCRVRDAEGKPPSPPPGIIPPSVVVPAPRPVAGAVSAAVRQALEGAGLLDEWGAAQALDLAESLDGGGGSGSARAALHRELRAVMGDLMRGVNDPSSRVGRLRDELAERRARRAGGA